MPCSYDDNQSTFYNCTPFLKHTVQISGIQCGHIHGTYCISLTVQEIGAMQLLCPNVLHDNAASQQAGKIFCIGSEVGAREIYPAQKF